MKHSWRQSFWTSFQNLRSKWRCVQSGDLRSWRKLLGLVRYATACSCGQ